MSSQNMRPNRFHHLWQYALLLTHPVHFRWCHLNSFVILCEYLPQIGSTQRGWAQRRSRGMRREVTARVRRTGAWPHSRSMRWPGVDCPTRNLFDSAPICPAINTEQCADKRTRLTSKPATLRQISNKMSIINGGEGSPFKWEGNLDNENQTKIHLSQLAPSRYSSPFQKRWYF